MKPKLSEVSELQNALHVAYEDLRAYKSQVEGIQKELDQVTQYAKVLESMLGAAQSLKESESK